MRVEVLVFGAAGLAVKSDRVPVQVEGDHATLVVRDVLRALHAQHPLLTFALPSPETGRLAVNQVLVGPAHRIRPGDELALITLVGGG